MIYYKVIFLTTFLILSGCAHVPRDGDFTTVQHMVNERIPQKVHWYQGGHEDAQVREALADLLKKPLTAHSAVQIALLNNRDLQSEYENLGIAQADLVQAGLLSNPVVFASIRFPKGGDGGNNIEFDLAKEFLDVLLRPARQRLATAEFARAKLRVAISVLDMAADVQTAFYKVQGKQQLADIQNVAADAAKVSYELAQRFAEAGNISERELAQERTAAADMSAEIMRTRASLQSARDDLNALLGLSGSDRRWILGHALPELPPADPDPDQMEDAAINQRLDLSESGREIEQLIEALQITSDYRWIGGAAFGVNTERDPDGSRVTGPNFSIEVPIFDQRQAEIARLESLLEQSKSRSEALKVTIQNDVRAAAHRVTAARSIVEYYRDELIPAREQVVKFTQQEQNYMLVDVFELLFVRQQQTDAYRGYIESLTDYWIARTDLARAVGAGLPDFTETATASPADRHPSNQMQNDQHLQHSDTKNQ